MQSSPQKRPIYPFLQALLFIFLGLNSNSIIGSSVTNSIAVSTVVSANCNLNNGSLHFGTYDPVGSNELQSLQTMGTVQIRCNKGTAASITLNAGENGSRASGTSRAMSSSGGVSVLNYDVYTDSSYSTVWSSSNPITYHATSSAPSTLNLYGKIPAQQDVDNGVYTDTIVITANF